MKIFFQNMLLYFWLPSWTMYRNLAICSLWLTTNKPMGGIRTTGVYNFVLPWMALDEVDNCQSPSMSWGWEHYNEKEDHHITPITPETLAAIATKGSSISFPESFCIQFQASISNPWILECRIFTPLQLSDAMRIAIICSMTESLLPIRLKGWEHLSSFCNSWKLEWPLSWTFQGCFSCLCFVLTRYLPFAIQIWED
jgi:hypothetical protein